MTPEQYVEFQQRIAQTDRAHHCKHGHYDCSDRDNGPCADEEYPHQWRLEDVAHLSNQA